MSYQEALTAAGAEVLAFGRFGDYQGTWWAKVRYQGELGWVTGSYGSCSGCDDFQAEFGWEEAEACEEHKYKKPQPDCAACKTAGEKYTKRLAVFGHSYLDDLLMSQESAEKCASENLEWDSETPAMLTWLMANHL